MRNAFYVYDTIRDLEE